MNDIHQPAKNKLILTSKKLCEMHFDQKKVKKNMAHDANFHPIVKLIKQLNLCFESFT